MAGRPSQSPTAASPRWLVLRQAAGPPISIVHAPALTRALRNVVMRFGAQPPSEMVSGHRPDGRPSEGDHVAYVALPGDAVAGRERCVRAVAVVVPAGAADDVADGIRSALVAWQAGGGRMPARAAALGWTDAVPAGALFLGARGEWWAEEMGDADDFRTPPAAARGPARHWRSALPVVLDRFPGELNARDSQRAKEAQARAAELVAAACHRCGYPTPAAIRVTRRAALPGIPDAPVFASVSAARGEPRQVLVHAELSFESPICGPLLLGRGRYFGLGLLVPAAPSVSDPAPKGLSRESRSC